MVSNFINISWLYGLLPNNDSSNDDSIPVVKFGEQGKAAILSYDIPEPTTYSGRNFISLQLPPKIHFKDKISENAGPPSEPLATRITSSMENPEIIQVRQAMMNGFSDDKIFPNLKLDAGILKLIVKESDSKVFYEIVSPEPISPKLKDLKPEEVVHMIDQGLRLNVYKALNGALTYNYVPHDFRSFGKLRKVQPSFFVPLYSLEQLPKHVSIEKINGSTNLYVSGTSPVSIDVEGLADRNWVELPPGGFRTIYSLVRVELQLEPEAPRSVGNNTTWKVERLGQVSGAAEESKNVRINAKAFYKVQVWSRPPQEYYTSFSDSKIVRVDIVGDGNGDHTPPSIDITTPREGEEFLDSGTGVNFDVIGSAQDPPGGAGTASGMDRVEVILDDAISIRTESTDPSTPWKSWKAHIELPHELNSKSHLITALAFDRANNSKPTSITINVKAQTAAPIITTLLLVESYKLSSFLGDFGLGRTVKTFSLLPGEKTKISIRTFKRSSETRKISSSILDSVSNESSDDFESSLLSEQSNKQNFQETENFKIDAHVDSGWGFGSASLNTSYSNETNAARENFSKNVTNSVKKHTSKASASRDVEVNTSYETQVVTEEETSIEREIENINLSRTLNFVFRQLNQTFYTFLHLVDVRVAFYKNDGINPPIYIEESLPFLDRLLGRVIDECNGMKVVYTRLIPMIRGRKGRRGDSSNDPQDVLVEIPNWQIVYDAILTQIQSIIDYNGIIHDDFITQEPFRDQQGRTREGLKYLRVNRNKVMSYEDPEMDPSNRRKFKLGGIILGVTKNVLRTEGIVAEALLGQANALDKYSSSLQLQTIREKDLNNDLTQSEIVKKRLGIKIIEEGNAKQAEIFEQVFPCCKPQMYSLWPPKDNEHENDEG